VEGVGGASVGAEEGLHEVEEDGILEASSAEDDGNVLGMLFGDGEQGVGDGEMEAQGRLPGGGVGQGFGRGDIEVGEVRGEFGEFGEKGRRVELPRGVGVFGGDDREGIGCREGGVFCA